MSNGYNLSLTESCLANLENFEALQEVYDTAAAGKDDAIKTTKLLDGCIYWAIVFRWSNFDGRKLECLCPTPRENMEKGIGFWPSRWHQDALAYKRLFLG
jgi:hypothetical protein